MAVLIKSAHIESNMLIGASLNTLRMKTKRDKPWGFDQFLSIFSSQETDIIAYLNFGL